MIEALAGGDVGLGERAEGHRTPSWGEDRSERSSQGAGSSVEAYCGVLGECAGDNGRAVFGVVGEYGGDSGRAACGDLGAEMRRGFCGAANLVTNFLILMTDGVFGRDTPADISSSDE